MEGIASYMFWSLPDKGKIYKIALIVRRMINERALSGILRNINTDVKIVVQALVKRGQGQIKSVSDILDEIKQCTNSEVPWSPDPASIREICDHLASSGVFHKYIKDKVKKGEVH